MITIYAASGDTLSGIAAAHDESLGSIEAANPQISNPNLIYVGEKIIVLKGSSWAPTPSSTSDPSTQSSPSAGSSGGAGGGSAGSSSSSSGGGGYHIPGVSDAVANCIAAKESSNGAASANVFQITSGSGYSYYPGESLAQQEATAGQIAATQGVQSAWGKYDGC